MGSQIAADEVLQIVERNASPASTPAIDYAELDDIISRSAVVDADGHTPGSDDWVETYDVNAAIAQVWEAKAAAVANRFDINIDRQGMSRSQMVAHFTMMADRFNARRAAVWSR